MNDQGHKLGKSFEGLKSTYFCLETFDNVYGTTIKYISKVEIF
jgi:hypothetical protein